MNRIYEKIIEGNLLVGINNKIYSGINRATKSLNRRTNILIKKIDSPLSVPFREKISKQTPIDDNVIMFITYQGAYTCNPKAVADECIRRNLPYDMYWVVKEGYKEEDYPNELKLVKRGSVDFYKAVAKAKVIIDNTHDLPRLGVHKKPEQILLQTWHGSLGIKRLDGNIVMGKQWQKIANMCQKETDYCISNSTFEDDVFHTSYWKDVSILKYGHARNDILFAEEAMLESIKEKVYAGLGIAEDVHLALYAPTHHDGENIIPFRPDYERVRKALESRFGGEWCIAVRLHSREKKMAKQMNINEVQGVVDATFYPDMQELMIASDFALTDYSSWIFDYMLLRRPAAIIADDLNDYMLKRDFYYPLESTPFPIAENDEGLESNILNFNLEKYNQELEGFLKDKGCMEDGHASERIVDKIVEYLKKA